MCVPESSARSFKEPSECICAGFAAVVFLKNIVLVVFAVPSSLNNSASPCKDNKEAGLRNRLCFNPPDEAKPWDYDGIKYKRYHLEPMKFNKLVSYRTNVIHGIYTDGSFYKNTPRKTITSTF